jgi:hypothetical protein
MAIHLEQRFPVLVAVLVPRISVSRTWRRIRSMILCFRIAVCQVRGRGRPSAIHGCQGGLQRLLHGIFGQFVRAQRAPGKPEQTVAMLGKPGLRIQRPHRLSWNHHSS